jgi:hypothetical protein
LVQVPWKIAYIWNWNASLNQTNKEQVSETRFPRFSRKQKHRLAYPTTQSHILFDVMSTKNDPIDKFIHALTNERLSFIFTYLSPHLSRMPS